MKLTNRQRMFVEAYLETWNGTAAARKAGYTHPDRQGYRLLRYVEIQDLIQERMKAAAMETDEVLARLSEQARASIADFVVLGEDGRLNGLNQEAVELRGHLVKKITTSEGKTNSVGIEMVDNQVALLALARRHGLLVDKTEGRLDVVEMTLDEWRAKQAERQEQVGETLADFEDDSEGIDA